jgi:hypothetical protein
MYTNRSSVSLLLKMQYIRFNVIGSFADYSNVLYNQYNDECLHILNINSPCSSSFPKYRKKKYFFSSFEMYIVVISTTSNHKKFINECLTFFFSVLPSTQMNVFLFSSTHVFIYVFDHDF